MTSISGPYRTPGFTCPGCGHPLDAHGTLEEPGAPAPGDFTVCAYCEAYLIFEGNQDTITGVHKLTQPAVQALPKEQKTELLKAHAMVRAMKGQR